MVEVPCVKRLTLVIVTGGLFLPSVAIALPEDGQIRASAHVVTTMSYPFVQPADEEVSAKVTGWAPYDRKSKPKAKGKFRCVLALKNGKELAEAHSSDSECSVSFTPKQRAEMKLVIENTDPADKKRFDINVEIESER